MRRTPIFRLRGRASLLIYDLVTDQTHCWRLHGAASGFAEIAIRHYDVQELAKVH